MLIAADGTRKQELAAGERKSIATDRVILVPGPAEEVRVVREIYQMLVGGKMFVSASSRGDCLGPEDERMAFGFGKQLWQTQKCRFSI